jgi:hypothetical protein
MSYRGGYYYPAFFYVQVLPELLRDRKQLHVLLATKDGIGEFQNGRLNTGSASLSVRIQADSLVYPMEELRLQASVGKDILAVVFADIGDLDEALYLLRRIRDDHPSACVTLITDEYALFSAPDKLKTALDMAFLDGLVITGLAGKIPMRKTLEHIIKEWGR